MAYRYYIVEHAFPARADSDTGVAEGLTPAGAWTPTDYYKVTMDGRVVPEEEALGFWAQRAKPN
jgi:hypothetical protein